MDLGYPADRPLRPTWRPNRRPVDEVVHRGRWLTQPVMTIRAILSPRRVKVIAPPPKTFEKMCAIPIARLGAPPVRDSTDDSPI